MVAQAQNTNTWEVEEGTSQVLDQPGNTASSILTWATQRDTVSEKQKQNRTDVMARHNDTVVIACRNNTWEADTGDLQTEGQPWLKERKRDGQGEPASKVQEKKYFLNIKK